MSRGDALTRLRQALTDHGCHVNGTSAQCPAHEDRTASLSIGQGKSGALINCHAGCETDLVLEAIGWSAADMFDDTRDPDTSRDYTVVATYTYTDELGEPLFCAERRMPKDFRQYHLEGTRKVYNLNGVRRVLYRLPKVLAAAACGDLVYIVEGEKDVHSIEAAGGVATCNPMGAGKWRDEYSQALNGAQVVIVTDKDDAGRKHAAEVANSVSRYALSVRVAEPAAGKDATDHLSEGYSLADFTDFTAISLAGEIVVPATGELSRLDELRGYILDTASLDSLADPEPLIDGILQKDSLAWLYGKPGSAKSFIALDWGCCVSVGLPWHDNGVTQGFVLYVIAEGVSGLRPRVRAWEDHAGTRTNVLFLPVAVQLLSPVDVQAIITLACEIGAVLIVFDTQARVTLGADENSARDMGQLVAAADQVRVATRACVLLVHHEARAGENLRGSTAIEGAAATLIRVTKDGSQIKVENTKQKDSAEFETLHLRLIPHLGSAVIQSQNAAGTADELNQSEQRLVSCLRECFETVGASPSTLLEVSELKKPTFYRVLNRLLNTGVVVNIGTMKRRHIVLAADYFPPIPPASLTESQ